MTSRQKFWLWVLALGMLMGTCSWLLLPTCESQGELANASLRYGWEDTWHEAITGECR